MTTSTPSPSHVLCFLYWGFLLYIMKPHPCYRLWEYRQTIVQSNKSPGDCQYVSTPLRPLRLKESGVCAVEDRTVQKTAFFFVPLTAQERRKLAYRGLAGEMVERIKVKSAATDKSTARVDGGTWPCHPRDRGMETKVNVVVIGHHVKCRTTQQGVKL